LGLAYQKINDKARAKTHLERVLHTDPTYQHADIIRNTLAELGRS